MVYLLYHRIQIDDEIYDDKLIGVYSSHDKAISTINRFTDLPGFSDYPDGFCIEPFAISGKLRYSNRFKKYGVYLIFVENLIDDEEVTESYDACANTIEAIFKLLFKIIRRGFIKKRFSIVKYYIDQDNWCEGFVTYYSDGHLPQM